MLRLDRYDAASRQSMRDLIGTSAFVCADIPEDLSIRTGKLDQGFNDLRIKASQHEKVPAHKVRHIERERFAVKVEGHKLIGINPRRREYTVQYPMRAVFDRQMAQGPR